MNRKSYSPAFASVYLDSKSIQYLSEKFDPKLWVSFEKRLLSVFDNIKIHINVDSKLETSIKRELIESNFILHTEVSSERQFLLKIGELLPPSIFQD
ncbi:spiro-SPASM protein, partial [Leptospira sp. 96542]|nr:spiro-SPASM protein [Leptospira sp. 96542]